MIESPALIAISKPTTKAYGFSGRNPRPPQTAESGASSVVVVFTGRERTGLARKSPYLVDLPRLFAEKTPAELGWPSLICQLPPWLKINLLDLVGCYCHFHFL